MYNDFLLTIQIFIYGVSVGNAPETGATSNLIFFGVLDWQTRQRNGNMALDIFERTYFHYVG